MREAFSLEILERMPEMDDGVRAWRPREAEGEEMLYGALAFVRIWMRGGWANAIPSLFRMLIRAHGI